MIRQSGARSLVFLVLVLALALTGCLRGSEEPTPAATGTAQPSTPAAVGSLNVFPSVADMVQEAIPAVVSIVSGSVELNLFLELVPQREGAGSGIIYNSQGFIVTNDHVIVNADSIHVTLSDGRSFDAVAVGRDPLTDLAVIKIEGNNFPFLAFGDPNQIRVGDPVIAIGHALALEGGPTVTAGVVSGLERTVRLSTRQLLEDLIQTDASIHPGNSGGPLLNLEGEVVGINTALDRQIPGMGFAISLDTILAVIDQLQTHGRVVRGYLGVTLATVTPSLSGRFDLGVEEGVMIYDVVVDTPAYRAGLRPLDVVTIFDGIAITTTEHFIELIRSHSIGTELEVTYTRGGEEFTTTVTLIERPR